MSVVIVNGASRLFEPTSVADCNEIASAQFDIMGGGPWGTGSFRPPDLQFAKVRNSCLQMLRYRQAGSASPVTTPAPVVQNAARINPLLVILLILIGVRLLS